MVRVCVIPEREKVVHLHKTRKLVRSEIVPEKTRTHAVQSFFITVPSFVVVVGHFGPGCVFTAVFVFFGPSFYVFDVISVAPGGSAGYAHAFVPVYVPVAAFSGKTQVVSV